MKTSAEPAVPQVAHAQPAFSQARDGSFFGSEGKTRQPFFSPAFVQPKLSIGRPGDKYEQEADAVADRVVQRLANPGATIAVQKKCQDCAEKEKLRREEEEPAVMRQVDNEQEEAPAVQAKAEKEEEESKVMRQTANEQEEAPQVQAKENKEEEAPGLMRQAGPEEEEPLQAKTEAGASSTPSLQSRLSSAKGAGAPMDKNTRQPMEAAFGQDFGRVRIHTDNNSAQMNRELNARAFTHGRDIYFNAGEYSPGSTEGRRLLAHELTHINQQRNEISTIIPTIQKKLITVGRQATAYQFKIGVELTLDFIQEVKRHIQNNKIPPTEIRNILNYALRKRETLVDSERMFLAGLFDSANILKFSNMRLRRGGSINFSINSIKNNIQKLLSLIRPKSISMPAMHQLGFGKIAIFAKRNNVRDIDLQNAMLKAASENSNLDMLGAAMVFAIAKQANHALSNDIMSGRIKIDVVNLSFIRSIPGTDPTIKAAYVPTAAANVSGYLKGDTIYLPKESLNIDNLGARIAIIHELEHAKQDKTGSKNYPKVIYQHEAERQSYLAESKYMLDQIKSEVTLAGKNNLINQIMNLSTMSMIAILIVAKENNKYLNAAYLITKKYRRVKLSENDWKEELKKTSIIKLKNLYERGSKNLNKNRALILNYFSGESTVDEI